MAKMEKKRTEDFAEGLTANHPLPLSTLASSDDSPKEPKAAWFTMNQRPLLVLLGALLPNALGEDEFHPNLTARFTYVHFRVLLQLIGKMGYGNWVDSAQTILSKELGISAQAYSRALRDLQQAEIIVRPYVSTASGVRPIIMINPGLAKKGKAGVIENSVKLFNKMLNNNHYRDINGRGGQRKGPKRTSKVGRKLEPLALESNDGMIILNLEGPGLVVDLLSDHYVDLTRP